jgi:hypothetical protein
MNMFVISHHIMNYLSLYKLINAVVFLKITYKYTYEIYTQYIYIFTIRRIKILTISYIC